MKKLRFFIFSFIIPVAIGTLSFITGYSQAGTWTWIKGDSSLNSVGNYGVKGIPSPTNAPASRYACGNWTDTAGNFWVYSGLNAPDDLWKFDARTLEWTWMTGDSIQPTVENIHGAKGVYDPLNTPGPLAFGMLSWLTPDNHLWLLGGVYDYGPANVLSDDFWQYDPGINQWAWMGFLGPAHYGTMGIGDSTTMPGGRQEGNCAWTDNNGNLWLFGGCDKNLASYNDMWQYNVASGIWTWMSGSKNAEDAGQYGLIGQPWTQNYPSARSVNFFWKDTAGNFWISGGTQFTHDLMFQDTWEFNPRNLNWTWVNGIQGVDTTTLGNNCIPDSLDKAGPRYENRATWKHCEDLIITYNGFNDWNSAKRTNNDLWGYKISTSEWVKINSWDTLGNYGTMGVASPVNYPPSRFGGVGFTGRDNGLWLFGGQVLTGGGVYYNDLWKYVIDTTCISCRRSCNLTPPHIKADMNIFCADDSATVCAPTVYTSYQWNVGGTGNCVTAKQAGDYYVTVTSSNGCTAESNHVLLSVYPVPPVSIIQRGDTLSSFGAVGYQWFLNGSPINNATSNVYVAKQPGSYAVAVTDTNGCTTMTNPVNVTTGINEIEEALISLFPNPNSKGSWQLSVGNDLLGSKLEIYDDNGRIVWKSEIRNQKTQIAPNIESGIYWLHISSINLSIVRKLVRL